MHDTSTESISRWKAVGAKRNQSAILSPSSGLEGKKQSRRYRPSKEKQISNSKLFNRNKSRIQSLDNIPKQDISDTNSKDGFNVPAKTRRVNTQEQKVPTIRFNSLVQQYYNNDQGQSMPNKNGKNTGFLYEKQFLAIKEDYTKFKQKILSELETQKQNITKMINQILSTVKRQLVAIQEKYCRNQGAQINPSLVPSFSTPALLQTSKSKLNDISTINHIPNQPLSRNPTEKALISQLTSLKTVEDDPISVRFSKFYSAIEKLKSDLDCLHEISVIQHNDTGSPMVSPMNSPSNANSQGFGQGFSAFLKT